MMDQMLIDRLVGIHCDRTASVANNDRCCTYRIDAENRGIPVNLTVRPQEILLVA
jgi:hypothetical protein